jgi:probable F420-dependent oxidoreductase
MPPIRVGVQIHPQHGSYEAMRTAALAVDELGCDLLYTWDHFFPLYGDPDGAHFECWSLLAAWAEATERVELGPLVSCQAYRNPNLLADMARTVDHISSGRLVFGIGAGWFDRDFDEYRYEFGSARDRAEALAGALPAILARWDRLVPGPVRRPPVVIGGVGPQRTLGLVARYADVWHAMFPEHPAELEPLTEALAGHCADVARDPTTIERAVGVEPEDLDRFLAGDADAYVELGFTQFTLGVNGPDYPLDPVSDWLAWRDARNRSG